MLIEANPDMEVVGEAADGDEAAAVTHARHPAVILMDIRGMRLSGETENDLPRSACHGTFQQMEHDHLIR